MTEATTQSKMKRSVSTSSQNAADLSSSIIPTPSTSKRKRCQMQSTDNNNKRSSLIINTTTTINNNNENELDILIVDDNPINISILKKSLFKILSNKKTEERLVIKRLKEASNGQEALDLLNQYRFDIIFLDIDMPILNGIDTTKCIRKKGSTTPIIAVTTNDSTESRDNYIKIGMNDCLSKPVDINLLEQALHNVLLLLLPQRQQQDHNFVTIIPSTPPLSSSCSTLPPSPEELEQLIKNRV